MKKVCIVGYGAIGPIHAAAISKVEHAKLYAVCDIDEERIEKCCKEYSVITYSEFDEMLSDENIDCVHICTPHHLHFEMIKKALRAGKEVVCEKPVTRTQEEFDELLQLENVSRVCVLFQNRYNPCIIKLKEIIESNEHGQIKAVKGIVTWNRTMDYYNTDAWRGKWDTEGGGVLINQSVHTLDYFSYLIGDIKSIQARRANFSLKEIEVEDTFMAHFLFENDVPGVFFATNSYGITAPPEFEVVMEKATLRYIDKKLYCNGNVIEEDSTPALGKYYWGRGHEIAIKNYYDLQKFFNPYDVRGTMNTMFAMYRDSV